MTAMDLLPTFGNLAGAKVPVDRVIDGKDVWSVMAGEAKSPHKNLFYHRLTNLEAIRSGEWKLHVRDGKPETLYNLTEDIGKKNNVLADNRDVARQLMKEIAAFEKGISENSRPAAFVDNPKKLSIQE